MIMASRVILAFALCVGSTVAVDVAVMDLDSTSVMQMRTGSVSNFTAPSCWSMFKVDGYHACGSGGSSPGGNLAQCMDRCDARSDCDHMDWCDRSDKWSCNLRTGAMTSCSWTDRGGFTTYKKVACPAGQTSGLVMPVKTEVPACAVDGAYANLWRPLDEADVTSSALVDGNSKNGRWWIFQNGDCTYKLTTPSNENDSRDRTDPLVLRILQSEEASDNPCVFTGDNPGQCSNYFQLKGWCSSNFISFPQNIDVELPRPKSISTMKVREHESNKQRSLITGFKIYGSSDGSTWEVLYTGGEIGLDTMVSFDLDQPGTFKHWRLSITSGHKWSDGNLFTGVNYWDVISSPEASAAPSPAPTPNPTPFPTPAPTPQPTPQPTPAPPPAPDWEGVDGDLDGKSADGVEEEEDAEKKKKKKKKAQMSCFPGHAVAEVNGRGLVLLSDLRVGDRVLAKTGFSEPVLGLMHAVRPQPSEFLTVVHSSGEFFASPSHILFVNEGVDVLAGNVQVGDHLYVGDEKSIVLSVRRNIESHGMFAPLTPSGTIVVDGVLASNYAGSSATLIAPHSAAHAISFPARMYHVLQQALTYFAAAAELHQKANVKEYHPYLQALCGPLGNLQSRLLA